VLPVIGNGRPVSALRTTVPHPWGYGAVAGALLTTIVATGCYRAESAYDLFLVPSEQFHSEVSSVVLAPTVAQTDVAVPESVLVRLDSLIALKLDSFGFDVVPSVVYQEIWTRLTEEAGGFYDPYTGEQDEELFEETVDELKRELQDGFDPDAIVYPEIWSVDAPVSYGRARWDGVERSAPGLTEVVALSLIVVVEDMEGKELYANGGGLGVAEAWDRTSGIEPRPPAAIFQPEGSLAEAVDVALNPLLAAR
jgi:hypothetical protein